VTKRSLLNESRQIERAVKLIGLGARLQVLEGETELSYERLLKLYKEVAGKSPPKGQLPFSTDWFLTWQPNIHASLFMNIFNYLQKTSLLDDAELLIKAYELYGEQMDHLGLDKLLSVTRAWRLMKFMHSNLLAMNTCKECSGRFVTDLYENPKYFVCGMCKPPARAGKGQASGSLQLQ
jgi:flagellar transcriptional activator FlhC